MDGLLYMKMSIPTFIEYRELPHVVMTSDQRWDQSKYNYIIPISESIRNVVADLPIDSGDLKYDNIGDIIDIDRVIMAIGKAITKTSN